MSSLALKLPNNYVEVERDEMEYVSGGVSMQNTWYGFKVLLNHNERVNLTDLQVALTGVSTAIPVPGLSAMMGVITSYVWNHDEGKGTELRFAGSLSSLIVGGYPIFIGAYAR